MRSYTSSMMLYDIGDRGRKDVAFLGKHVSQIQFSPHKCFPFTVPTVRELQLSITLYRNAELIQEPSETPNPQTNP